MLYPNNWAGLFICEAKLTNHNFTLYIAKVENFSETTLLYLIDQYCSCTKYQTYAGSKKRTITTFKD